MSTQMLNMLFYYKIMNVAVGKLKTVFEINGTSLPLVAPRKEGRKQPMLIKGFV